MIMGRKCIVVYLNSLIFHNKSHRPIWQYEVDFIALNNICCANDKCLMVWMWSDGGDETPIPATDSTLPSSGLHSFIG